MKKVGKFLLGIVIIGIIIWLISLLTFIGGAMVQALLDNKQTQQVQSKNEVSKKTSVATSVAKPEPEIKDVSKTESKPQPKLSESKPKEQTSPKPTLKPQPEPDPEPKSESVYYKNCSDAKSEGAAPLYKGEPGYRSGLDRDKDGVACE